MSSPAEPRLYTDDEAKRVFERALRLEQRASGDALRHEELVAAAKEVGIGEEALERAILQLDHERREGEAKAAIIAQRRRGIRTHLAVFCAVNLLLAYLNWITTPQYLWFRFPMGAWGLALFLHVWFAWSSRVSERRLRRQLRELERRALPPRPLRPAPERTNHRTAELFTETVDAGVAALLEMVRDELRKSQSRKRP